jgi:hypothetical protein
MIFYVEELLIICRKFLKRKIVEDGIMASIKNIFDQIFEDKLPMPLKKSLLFDSNAQHELETVRPPKVQLREMFGKMEPCSCSGNHLFKGTLFFAVK